MPSLLCVPAESVAPAGTPEMVIFESTSEPSVLSPPWPAEMFSAIGVSSLPVALATLSVGASMTASVMTLIVPVATLDAPLSLVE